MAVETLPEPTIQITTPFRPGLGFLTATPIIAAASICLALVIASAVLAPWLSPHDPLLLAPAQRLKPASAQFWLGTDGYGRDVLSRILYGGRISLLIGLGAAVVSIGFGLVIGLVSGFFKWVDAIMMRVMDGLMAIPSILLAIAVVSLSARASRRCWSPSPSPKFRGSHVWCDRWCCRRGKSPMWRQRSHWAPVCRRSCAAPDAEHGRAPDRARHLRLRVCDPDRGDPVVFRRSISPETRPGATSWRKAAPIFK